MQEVAASFADSLRRRRPQPGDKWHMDEVLIRIQGVQHYLWRAVDQDGVVLDILVQARRDAEAAKCFFKRLLNGLQYEPRVIVTDKLASLSVPCAWGLRLPFITAAALSFVNLCFGLFVLPESLDRANRHPLTSARAKRMLVEVAHDRALTRLAIAWSCTWIGLGAVQSSLVLFTGYRFGWGPQLNGLVLAGVGL